MRELDIQRMGAIVIDIVAIDELSIIKKRKTNFFGLINHLLREYLL